MWSVATPWVWLTSEWRQPLTRRCNDVWDRTGGTGDTAGTGDKGDVIVYRGVCLRGMGSSRSETDIADCVWRLNC